MKINNGFNILPWYDSLEKQNCKKWYAYGQAWPLLCPQGFILPFQFISDTAITISSNIYAISVETGQTIDLGVKPTVTEIRRADITYYIVKLVSTSIVNLPIGRYNLRMNTSEGFLYSEELVVINNANECIKVEYWNEDTLKFTSGEINFTDDFHFIFYINSTIGKPEYEFEEELTKRLGYKFIESQTSNKVYKFSFVAPEYICDAMRLIRMCDYIKLATKFDSYNALSFAYEPKWQEQGDLAAVDVEFDTDCIIQKLESFNRRAKESFYNALLADIDEPVLFSTDTVAQYYTEYTASGTISGKLIRQLTAISEDELVSSLSSIVLPVDNQSDNSQVAKKAFLSDIVNKLIPKVNLSDYLLKSIWDKVFEIRTDKQGKEYIFGKLPVVTQYGITMYADGGDIDLPSLYTGLPIDGKTLIRDEKGVLMVNPDIELGGGVSNFWDLSGIPSWITNSKPKYSYSEIQGTPDLSVYAQVDALKAYVTLAGAQTLTGEKNFTGGLKVNGSPIIYDSANKYWKLQGNLVLTGGITMYADDGTLNLPSIYDGLPIDGTTIYWDTDAAGNRVIKAVIGGGTADSVAWVNITGKPTWIGSSKPVYSYSEIQGTPDLSVYALKTQIPSLSGYATESWVTKQNYATKATTLSGYGITDAYTKTNVDDLFKACVTLAGAQTITGEKNFTGGLKVNGSPIYYDTEKKYWKLEGDLLVTGGVTMYGNDSSFTPSTIMDAIAVDGTTISKDGGVLKVIGGTGGGVADSVAWVNITGKPTWIGSSKPTYSYSEITGAISTTELQNYLTQNSYLNVTSGDNRYLKLSGGDLKGALVIKTSALDPLTVSSHGMGYKSYIYYQNGTSSGYDMGGLGFSGKNVPSFRTNSTDGGKEYKLLHENNYSSYALPLSGGTITGTLEIKCGADNKIIINNTDGEGYSRIVFQENGSYIGQLLSTKDGNIHWGESKIWHSGNFNPSNYLPLSGGTINGNIQLGNDNNTSYYAMLVKQNGNVMSVGLDYGYGTLGYRESGTTNWNLLSVKNNDILCSFNGGNNWNTLIHSGNIGEYTIRYYGNQGAIDFDNVLYNGVQYTSGSSVNGGKHYGALMSLWAGDTAWQIVGGRANEGLMYRSGNGTSTSWSAWKTIAFTDSNVASATKLQTARTIWGQNFDGTGNVSGRLDMDSLVYFMQGGTAHGYLGFASSDTDLYLSANRTLFISGKNNLILNGYSDQGNVGIGTEIPISKCDINGLLSIRLESSSAKQSSLNLMNTSSDLWQLSARYGTSDNGNFNIYYYNGSTWANPISINKNGNLLATGGITMYSMRALKNVVDERGLSLTELSVIKPTRYTWKDGRDNKLHFGGIADDIQQVLPEVVYSTSDGILTMDYGNAAFAVASSLIQPVVDHEKRITRLQERIVELEEEVKLLKES